jgi:hypothetical protein
MIGALSMAMKGGLSLGTLAGTVHPYPTESDAIKKAAGAWNKTRLTPTAASALSTLLRFRR